MRTTLHRLTSPALVLSLAISSLFTSNALAAGPSTQLSVTGAVEHPAVFDAVKLGALPSVMQSVTYGSGSGRQNRTYQGPSLWGVLNGAGIVTTSAKNDVLNRYVLATGSDGYKVVFSLGELNPNFGNRPDLLAYSEQVGGSLVPLGADGFARVTAPGDVKGGRYVSNLVNLDVRTSGSTKSGTGGGVSTQFTVSGLVNKTTSFDLAALKSLPSITQTVGTSTYTGVSLWSLLDSAVGISTNSTVKNDILSMYVVATGSDGYKSVFSMGELNPAFGNQPDLIAYSLNGDPLTSNGFARLVVPNDVKAGRYVSNLVSLEVFRATSAVPEPEALALAGAGLMALFMVKRSGRKPDQAAN
jgi:hypothetical protein